jgi:hypothetical protein
MPRGGKRQGTPGKAYSNRTDMGTNYDMAAGSPATGGLEPSSKTPDMSALSRYPEDTPSLTDPTQRPNEPISDGLTMGPGRGRDALTNYDPRKTEAQALKRWLPIMEPTMRDPETPDSVKMLIQYIRGI